MWLIKKTCPICNKKESLTKHAIDITEHGDVKKIRVCKECFFLLEKQDDEEFREESFEKNIVKTNTILSTEKMNGKYQILLEKYSDNKRKRKIITYTYLKNASNAFCEETHSNIWDAGMLIACGVDRNNDEELASFGLDKLRKFIEKQQVVKNITEIKLQGE